MQRPTRRGMSTCGRFAYDTKRDVICEKLREIFGQEPGVKDWWTPGKVGSVGKVSFHTNDHRSSPTDQSSCGTPGIARKRKSSCPRGLTGDQSPAYSGGGERLLDEWSTDGHRWRLGAGPCVVQKTEDGWSGHHDLQADQQLLLASGVHTRIGTGLG